MELFLIFDQNSNVVKPHHYITLINFGGKFEFRSYYSCAIAARKRKNKTEKAVRQDRQVRIFVVFPNNYGNAGRCRVLATGQKRAIVVDIWSQH